MPIHPETQAWLNTLPLYKQNPQDYKFLEDYVPTTMKNLPRGQRAFMNPATKQTTTFDPNYGHPGRYESIANKCGIAIGNRWVPTSCSTPGAQPMPQTQQAQQQEPQTRAPFSPEPPRSVGAISGTAQASKTPTAAARGSQNLQLPIYTPEQGDIMNSMLLQGIGNFNPNALEQQARSQFNRRTIPTLAERFTAMGEGAQRSSAFQGQLGEAGSELEELLASLRGGVGQSQLGMGLQPSYENVYLPGGGGFLQGLQQGGAQGVADMVGPAMRAGLNWYSGNSAEPAQQLASGEYTGLRANSAPVTSNTGAWLTQLMDMFKNIR